MPPPSDQGARLPEAPQPLHPHRRTADPGAPMLATAVLAWVAPGGAGWSREWVNVGSQSILAAPAGQSQRLRHPGQEGTQGHPPGLKTRSSCSEWCGAVGWASSPSPGRLWVQFPVRAHTGLGAWSLSGTCERGSPSVFLSPFSLLPPSKNKKIICIFFKKQVILVSPRNRATFTVF